ncbi:hypothetical protein E2562_028721 [Oryza meyeriana var. granulata]|uniref:Uncharacterized protein n=1 Tax=Oryza meyeriana var. granulata TaxID=110450 RepID=A0A6G1D8U0_9ORYZ|nr:hypothetical protein E2562_028721 [Oryza meyeriana var. granulata]
MVDAGAATIRALNLNLRREWGQVDHIRDDDEAGVGSGGRSGRVAERERNPYTMAVCTVIRD